MFNLRVDDTELRVDWIRKFTEFSAAEVTADGTTLLNKKEPSYIFPDPKAANVLYLIGRYRGLGSVIRYNKRDGTIRWHAQFDTMSRINSVSVDTVNFDDDLFLCGEAITDEKSNTEPYGSGVEITSQIVRMKNDGEVNWIIDVTGQNPLYNSATPILNQDRCVAVSYNKQKENVAVILQGKMGEVRPSYKADYFDTILVLISEGGETEDIVVITQGTTGYDMLNGKNALFWVGNDEVFFAGSSKGFETKR